MGSCASAPGKANRVNPNVADPVTTAEALGRLSAADQRLVRELVWKLLTLQGYLNPGLPPPTQVDAGAFVWEWAAALVPQKSPATIRVYRFYVTKALSNSPAPTAALLDAFVAARAAGGASPATIATTIFALKSFFGYLSERGVLSANPAEHLKPPAIPQRERAIPRPEHIARLLAAPAATPRDQALILLFADCGLRADEALTLHPGDVDLERLQVTVIGKRNKQRTVPMSPATRAALKSHLSTIPPSPWVFPGRDPGDHLDESSLDCRFRYLSRRAGIAPISPHQLRHHYASALLNDGANLKIVSQLLGHKNTGVTANIYWHILGAEERRRTHRKHNPLREVLGASNSLAIQGRFDLGDL